MEEAVRPLSEIPAIDRFLSYCRVRTVPAKTVTSPSLGQSGFSLMAHEAVLESVKNLAPSKPT